MPAALPLTLLGDVAESVPDLVALVTPWREEPPWPTSDGLVVVVGPEVDRLAGPGVGEQTDRHVRFA